MKPRVEIASAQTPDGSRLALVSHDGNYIITVDRQDLVLSRAHESELELARLGCAGLADRRAPAVLVGGLGMGYTVRQALDLLPAAGTVVVAELLPEIVQWNRDILGELAGHPLRDPRVDLRVGDVAELIRRSPAAFDAVLLDVDNGPHAVTDPRNARLYHRDGLRNALAALRPHGRVAIWSASLDDAFEHRLREVTPHMRRFRAPTHAGGRTRPHCIWVAANQPQALPAPRPPHDLNRSVIGP